MYTVAKALFIAREVELIRKKEFVTAALNSEDKTFVGHLASLTISNEIFFSYKAQIASFRFNKTLITIFSREYVNFTDVFFLGLATELQHHMKIDNHNVDWIKNI